MLRGRRLRRSTALREMLREHTLRIEDLICPLFIAEDESAAGPVPSMPGVKRHFVGRLDGVLDEIARLGLRGVILFGIPAHKDACGSGASDPDGVVCRAIRAIKARLPELVVIADVCLCEYTDHGHCGLVRDGRILNDETLPALAAAAIAYARAGADIVAPSDMMDGRVAAIRAALDAAGIRRARPAGVLARRNSKQDDAPQTEAGDFVEHTVQPADEMAFDARHRGHGSGRRLVFGDEKRAD